MFVIFVDTAGGGAYLKKAYLTSVVQVQWHLLNRLKRWRHSVRIMQQKKFRSSGDITEKMKK